MNIEQLHEELSSTTSLTQARLVFDLYLKKQGFSHYAFTCYSGHIKTGRELHYHCVSAALRPWHNYYLEQGYADIDRTMETSVTKLIPLPWEVSEQLQQAKNTREKRMREESIEFGIDKGLSIPVYGPHNNFALLTLHQTVGQDCLNSYRKKQFEWQAATLHFYHHVCRLLDTNEIQGDSKLSKREKQCLELTARARRVEQIAKELGITERTVHYHIQNANRKLGTNSKYLSIYKYFSQSKTPG